MTSIAPGALGERDLATESDGAVESRAQRGVAALLGGQMFGELLRLGSNLILVRLLDRSYFGLMLLANVILRGFQLFSDIGIVPSIVQSTRGDDPRFLDSAWTLQVVRGLLLFATAQLVAAPLARFYGEPALEDMLRIAALAPLLQGLASTRIASAQRQLRIGRITTLRLVAGVGSVFTMITWALIAPSVWALVAGGVAHAAVLSALSHTALPGHRNRLAWHPELNAELLRFGRWIFVSTAFTFIAAELDSLFLGKFIDTATLGVYAIAINLARMPRTLLNRVNNSVIFPFYSHALRQDGGREVYLRARGAMLSASGWIVSGFAAGGAVIVALLYPDDYAVAGWITSTLSVGVWVSTLALTNGAVLLASGHANWGAAGHASKALALAVAIPVGFHLGALPGAVVAIAISDLGPYLVFGFAASRQGMRGFTQDLTASVRFALAAGGAFLLARALLDAGVHPSIAAAAVFTFCTAVWWSRLVPLLHAVRPGRGSSNSD